MSETKHTPGPWEFRTYTGGCTVVSSHEEPGTSVRDRLKGVTIKIDAIIRDDQSNASDASPDARLICAAPDLLEACIRALPYLRDHIGMTRYEGPGDRIALDLCEEAIAKATGESS
jgi:hypothetical protein